jgi:hypothetical protein
MRTEKAFFADLLPTINTSIKGEANEPKTSFKMLANDLAKRYR